MMTKKNRAFVRPETFLKILTWLFYLFFVFLWFKGNIPALRGVKIGPAAALIPLAGLFLFRVFTRFSKKRSFPCLRMDRKWILPAVILLVTILFRVPFLVHSHGLVSSDVAVPCLMGKHIAEGKQAPVYYYGQLYLGSLASHFYALVFFLFGYSVWLFKLSNLLFYLGFMAVQYLLLRDIFGERFALAVSFVYSLPIGYLTNISLDNSGVYSSLVLFLGSLVVTAAYRAGYKGETACLPFLGFIMGLSFWSHQISIFFILTGLFILLVRFGRRFHIYFKTGVFFVIGAFPLVLHEAAEGFPLLKFLSPGGGGMTLAAKLKNAARLLFSLFAGNSEPARLILLALAVAGLSAAFLFSLKEKRFSAKSLYGLFFLIFLTVYLLSGFSVIPVHRYVFPAVFCLPVLLLSPVLWLRFPWKNAAAVAAVLCLFALFGVKDWMNDISRTAARHDLMNRVIASMKETGEKAWQGDYWTAYLISALSAEDVIVDSYTINRYYPYRLIYHNRDGNENYVFLRGEGHVERERALHLRSLLEKLGIQYSEKSVGDCLMIYGIQSPVSRSALTADIPDNIPQASIKTIVRRDGFIEPDLMLAGVPPEPGFRIHAGIQGFCRRVRGFSPERNRIRVGLPYPPLDRFPVYFYLDYKGLIIPSSHGRAVHRLSEPPAPRRQRFVFLEGIGPEAEYRGEKGRICLKDAAVEINGPIPGGAGIRLNIISPFGFSHPYWYGRYRQKMKGELNGILIAEEVLEDGANAVFVDLEGKNVDRDRNVLTLKFTYHLPFESALLWKTSALLQDISLEQPYD